MGSLDRACGIARAELQLLTPDDVRKVIEAAFEVCAFAPGTELAGELFLVTASPDDAVSHGYGLARLGDRAKARDVFSELAALLSSWKIQTGSLDRLRDLAQRSELTELIGPELSHLALRTEISSLH